MASKKAEQLTKAMQRGPRKVRLLDESPTDGKNAPAKTYSRLTITLYNHELGYVDRLVDLFKRSRIRSRSPKSSNRSLVMQQLLLLAEESLEGKNEQEIAQLFRERVARRLDA